METMHSQGWFLDASEEHRWILHRIKKHLYSFKTRFQNVELIETHALGTVLVLDGKIQSAQKDEHIYHEMLVHPAMLSHPGPERVLVLGGGEGATLREVLKHPSVKKAVMVDIDRELVEFCKKHLKGWHRGALSEKRSRILFVDALDFVKKTSERFDVIISDLSDPVGGGPASLAYTKEFYGSLLRRLSPGGIFVTQAAEATMGIEDVHSSIRKTVEEVFPVTESYVEYVPSFASVWGFVAGSKTVSLKSADPRTLRRRLKERKPALRHYNPETHARAFILPPALNAAIKKQKKVSTRKSPVSLPPPAR